MKKLILFIILMINSFSLSFSQGGLNEKIDRGVIALTIDGTHAYIGWRLLITDPPDIAFKVYRKQVGFETKRLQVPTTVSLRYLLR